MATSMWYTVHSTSTQPASISNWPGSGPNLVMPNTFFVISGTMGLTCSLFQKIDAVKLVDEEHFDKEQTGVKEPFPVTNCQFTS